MAADASPIMRRLGWFVAVAAGMSAFGAAAQEPQSSGGAAMATAMLPRDLSVWGMFMAADPMVKGVMIGLVLASVVTWTVGFAKTLEIAAAKRRARAGLVALLDARSMAEGWDRAAANGGPARDVLAAARAEFDLSGEACWADGVRERVASRLARVEAAHSRAAARGTGVLATIGATAPFVGLFGTVWGIMDSFIGISKAHATNLAIVAPGIAEALLATAFGLAAAIPAVVIYNACARAIAGYRLLLGDLAAAALRLASRDLEARWADGARPQSARCV